MRDAGHDESDVLLKKMQAEVEDVYRTAQKDLQKKIDDYVGKFAKDDAKKQKLVANGKMSQEDYEAWKQKTMLTGKQYRQMLNTVSTDLTNADQIARSIINGYTPEAYAVGMNYGTYQIESGTTFNTNFTLYNRETVERLLRDDPQLLPMPKVNIPKDKAWNYKQVNRQLTQGILQGESMPKIAKRFEAVTPSKTVADIKDAYKKTSEQIAKEIAHKNKVAAIRNARTAVNGAENAGRMDSFYRAKEMGIGVKKQWLATPDGRTRDSHVEIDLEVVELEENFSNGCEYPCDPGGDPAETYNCRCAMIPWLDRFGDKFDGERAMNLHGMTYDEWKESHRRDAISKVAEQYVVEQIQQRTVVVRNYDSPIARAVGRDEYDSICDMLDACENDNVREAYISQFDKILVGSTTEQGAYHSTGSIYFDAKSDSSESRLRKKHSVFFHESAHAVDWRHGQERGTPRMFSASWHNGEFSRTIHKEVNAWIDRRVTELKAEFQAHRADISWLQEHGYLSTYAQSWLQQYADSAGVTLEDILLGKHKVADRWAKGFVPKFSKSRAYSSIEDEIKELIRAPGGDHAAHALSDIVGGATKGKVSPGWGHAKSYWNYHDVRIEAFAEMMEAHVSGAESLATLEQYLPESVKTFREMIADYRKD